MPRVIKFRAWDNEKKVMVDCNAVPVGMLNKYEVPPMQFTGLLDKNGIKIYEGDIVKFERAGGTCFGIIEWFYYTYRVAYKIRHDPGLPEKREEYLCSGYIESDHQVIGNIWEHPNLLK